MADAWGGSWGVSWGVSWGTSEEQEGAGRYHRVGLRDIPQRGRRLRRVVEENRERWRELLGLAEETQQKALARAEQLDAEARRELEEAAEAAKAAIVAAHEAEAGMAAMQRLVASLKAAATAKRLATIVERALAAQALAKELERRLIELLDDEDDEVLMLMG